MRWVGLGLALVAIGARAVGLGDVAQQSELGRPLRIVIPIIASPAEELSPECFKVAPATRDGDGVPEIANARINVEQVGARQQLVVTTSRPVNDPAVRIALQVGCENKVRRDFVLLLDPEPVVAPAVAAASLPASRNDAASADVNDVVAPGGATRGVAPEATIVASPPATPAATETPPRRRAPPATSAKPRAPVIANPARPAPTPRAAARPLPAAKAAPAKPPSPPVAAIAAVAPQPRLTVSSSAPVQSASGVISPKPVQSAQEATNALEAETIVLRQRVTELSELVERMQLEMRAAQASQAARLAAEEAARSAPQAVIRRWWDDAWPILLALVALAALIAASLAWRRRRGLPATTAWKTSRTPPNSIAPVSTLSGVATTGAVEPVAATAAAGPTTQSGNVDVSELSHVTEEAGVYLAFNRVDRAIEVLREHIRGQPRSLPAAWLMLLDIYRTHGREQEFRELATEYHRQFNAKAPLWDADATPEDETNAGLEAFPHVVNQLVRLWGKPECREFLELLLYDNRDGRRVGFSPSAYSDILMLRQIADPAAVSVDAHHFGGHELRPAWAANPAKPEAVEGIASRPAGGAPAAGNTPSVRPLPLEPLPDSPVVNLAPRIKAPAALDLEIAFDEDITKTAPAPRDKTPGTGSQGR